MRKALIGLTLVVLVLGACAPQAQPTEPQPVIVEQPTKISVDLTPAQRIAISTLAENLGITADKIKLLSTEAVDWPDACLGITREGISCAQVVTPGFRVTLEADGKKVEYHTNQDASVIRPATVALTWSRVGGVAGFCDNLVIYLSGEVQGSTCNGSEMVEKRLTDLLTAEEISMMNDWISKYGLVNIDMSDPAGVADAMSVKLQLVGLGTEQMPKATQQILVQFIQNLNQELMAK